MGLESALNSLYFGWGHSEGGFADFRREDCEFLALFDSPLFPLIGEFVPDGDAWQAFFDPFFRVTLLLVDLTHALGGEFRVFDLFEPLVADLGEPEFERFGFGGWDGLDDTQELFGIGDIGHALFSVSGGHFQTVTIRHGFISFLL